LEDPRPAAASGSASAGSAAAGSAAAPAAPAAAGAGCPQCAKFDACCAALAAIPDSGVDKSDCDGRGPSCAQLGDEMKGDMDDTCKGRVAEWAKDHPDVAACQ
jgi:hypothetical protein